MSQQPQILEVARKQIEASQAEWIDHPTTQMFMNALSAREFEYQRRLIDRCLTLTDANADIQDRACISTCKAIKKIMTDPDLFVKYSTLKTT